MNTATLIALIVILAAAGLATASLIRAHRCRMAGSGGSATDSGASAESGGSTSGTTAGSTNSAASGTCRGCALSPFCRKRG